MAINLNSSRFLLSPVLKFPPPLLLPPKFISSRPKIPRLGFRFRRFSCYGAAGVERSRLMEGPVTVKEKIDLTEKEEKIFKRLLDVLKHFELETQLRVAGGWVRDKLLDKDCYDIDIALDNMLGREFCDKVNEYLQCAGEEQQGVAVIQSNPDQSKHLETARMRIYDTWIDFVNLRSETYVENSRIPTMKFGTAMEDAFRRDLTINSLFYNINTNSVEDFTRRGLRDLKNGYIATPLPPKSTFLDDPLRVLRAIRFGARFAFELDEELKKAASDEEVKTALADKISRERIGHEVDLMISGNHPVKAMAYICDLQLFFTVFILPDNPQPEVFEGCDRMSKALVIAGMSSDRLYFYGTLFLPLRNMVYIDRKSKKIPVTSYIFKNSLKLKNSDAEMVVSLHAACERFISLIPLLEANRDSEVKFELEDEYLDISPISRMRVLAGLLLRQIKDFWRVSLLMSTLIYPTDDHSYDSNGHLAPDHREIFLKVESTITELGLDKVWELKPLLDGKAIMGVLQLKTGGPLVKEWQDRVVKWQLAHPESTAEECLDWMRESQAKRTKLDCS
ncbi:uncharacterized protein A4U43_C02F7040 [Asparagus officinalis]|uniref:Poly A polymerase head domain-containing protein n=1 Tax=Asparagus officinalis TaxID=4686 RepID=A0A5P1FHE0_ASPOF|nr:uncharacterized protein A4U43_C02F7040 [Asparagus officinalis]